MRYVILPLIEDDKCSENSRRTEKKKEIVWQSFHLTAEDSITDRHIYDSRNTLQSQSIHSNE